MNRWASAFFALIHCSIERLLDWPVISGVTAIIDRTVFYITGRQAGACTLNSIT
ncbi:hypothetical protein [Endozoicomonas arenosclerae]|uniref:hypothetical protein n=1 Tax=Endozoicomonas arenosclerae TaxID=1633495 RepID=UPI000B2C4A17|nr:hypothetical protein [Endozoicomonas arenosclerae]